MFDPERELQQSWSIGRLRPWLHLLAQRELPAALRGRVDPSDIVQETLLHAWRAQGSFRGTTHAERLGWLRAILKNSICQSQRRLAAKKRGGQRELTGGNSISPESPTIDELAIDSVRTARSQLIAAEETLELAEALRALPEDQRRVIELRHFDCLTHEQIAEKLGRSTAAVRMLWVRGLKNLKQTGD